MRPSCTSRSSERSNERARESVCVRENARVRERERESVCVREKALLCIYEETDRIQGVEMLEK